MEVTVNITRRDLFKLQLYSIPRSKSNWIVFAFLWVFIFYSTCIGDSFDHTTMGYIVLVISSTIVTTLCLLFGLVVSVIFVLVNSKKNNGILGEHKYQITEEGLYEQTIANETLTKWISMHHMSKAKKYIIVNIGPCLYHLLPKRAFKSESDFNDFYQLLSNGKENNF